uniref:Metal-dependent hydrolase n=1 Tax=Candidatus Aschnera chinzeii TaxID=1485666 RepID=A0AAT9G546_9ENTR|nr:MAG: metal-dependent hydrolase [Candidatus Aschnera chinzeii]
MTAVGHMMFSVTSLILVHKLGITPEFIHGDWLHLLVGVLFGSLLPDIDHPCSLLGSKFRFISIPISRLCGHRGFTHSFCAWLLIILFFFKLPCNQITCDFVLTEGLLLGYLSHIIGDMLTIRGVPFLWPLKLTFCLPILGNNNNIKYERFIIIIFFIFVVCIPSTFQFSLLPALYEIKKIYDHFLL